MSDKVTIEFVGGGPLDGELRDVPATLREFSVPVLMPNFSLREPDASAPVIHRHTYTRVAERAMCYAGRSE